MMQPQYARPQPQYPPVPRLPMPPRTQQARQPQAAPLRMPAPPLARMQSPEEETRPLELPSPEALGIRVKAKVPESAAAWAGMVERLESLGVTEFRFEADGEVMRFVCVVPTAEGPRQLESTGRSKSEAVQQALTWLTSR